MKQKVSLSASFSDDVGVAAILETCDFIYTTQARHYGLLCNRFPNSDIRCIPCCTEEMMNLIKSWHPNADFVNYSDLRNAQRGVYEH